MQASCATEVIGSEANSVVYQTTCDTQWGRLGNAIGWAKLCGYGGETGRRLNELHLKIKAAVAEGEIDSASGQAYLSAAISKARYESTSGCSRAKIETLIQTAHQFVRNEIGKPLRSSSVQKTNQTPHTSDLTFGNSVARVEIFPSISQVITRSDGARYEQFWRLARDNQPIAIGFMTSNENFIPKRYEFTYYPASNLIATIYDGVQVLILEDENFVQDLTAAAEEGPRYLYLSGRDDSDMSFYWWRLERE